MLIIPHIPTAEEMKAITCQSREIEEILEALYNNSRATTESEDVADLFESKGYHVEKCNRWEGDKEYDISVY